MKAVFQTKSNHRNTNGKELTVVSISGRTVTAIVEGTEYGDIKVDFSLDEVSYFIGEWRKEPDYSFYTYKTQ